MLSGGLGITEGSLSLFLIHGGMPKVTAVAFNIHNQSNDLWFAVYCLLWFLF